MDTPIDLEIFPVLSDEDAEKVLQAHVGDEIIVTITRMSRADFERTYSTNDAIQDSE